MKTYNNVLEDATIEFINEWVQLQKTHACWRTNIHAWDSSISDKSLGCVSILDIKNNEELYEIVTSQLIQYCPYEYHIYSILYYEWNALSQINWHKDGNLDERRALTIYLNTAWDRNWGGFLCWEDATTTTYHMTIPTYNLGILIEPDVCHHVSIISPYAPPRKTLQVWMHKKL